MLSNCASPEAIASEAAEQPVRPEIIEDEFIIRVESPTSNHNSPANLLPVMVTSPEPVEAIINPAKDESLAPLPVASPCGLFEQVPAALSARVLDEERSLVNAPGHDALIPPHHAQALYANRREPKDDYLIYEAAPPPRDDAMLWKSVRDWAHQVSIAQANAEAVKAAAAAQAAPPVVEAPPVEVVVEEKIPDYFLTEDTVLIGRSFKGPQLKRSKPPQPRRRNTDFT